MSMRFSPLLTRGGWEGFGFYATVPPKTADTGKALYHSPFCTAIAFCLRTKIFPMNTPTPPITDLSGLEPAPVWAHFATLCRIPRPSKNEAALREHLRQWATERHLESMVDAAGNLIIRKSASPGRENVPGTILQAHLDMVCQKNADTVHDFSHDPIMPVLRDGWLRAENTTLGADNGIGVALALAVLEDDGLKHGPIEALFTVDEEAGMGGARGLESGQLQGRRMLNLDTEEWGEFYLGCAGGLDVNVSRSGTAEAMPPGYSAWRITLNGLRGGHSGVNIHEERGNAIKLLVRVLKDLDAPLPNATSAGLRLSRLDGGTARNALPREAFAEVCIAAGQEQALHARLTEWQDRLVRELQGVDEGVRVFAEPVRVEQVMSTHEQSLWLASLHAAPHGVRRMSRALPGVVETSCNLGMVALTPTESSCNFLVRSLIDGGVEMLGYEILSLFSLSGTRASTSGYYPGWAPKPDSPLLALCQSVYRRTYGQGQQDAKVQVIHAGLECGLIGAKYPGLDIVSFGPTIHGPHAPGEAVEVASVERTWGLLTAILAAMEPASR